MDTLFWIASVFCLVGLGLALLSAWPLSWLAYATAYALWGVKSLIERGFAAEAKIYFTASVLLVFVATGQAALDRRKNKREQKREEGKDACEGLNA